VSIDIGTGAGQAVLRRGREHPAALVIGLDADARAMADASRHASANERRGGLPNAVFLAAAAEDLPGLLCGTADHVTVALPWGSLLRGLLAPDATLVEKIRDLLKPGGGLELLLSATDRDSAAAGVKLENHDDVVRLTSAYEAVGLRVVECRPADLSDVDRLSSAWGRRLGIPTRRRAWLIRAVLGRLAQAPGSGVGSAAPSTCSRLV
jgi:16S rRNA (adenine(1408)-N(1))-methyltransferase